MPVNSLTTLNLLQDHDTIKYYYKKSEKDKVKYKIHIISKGLVWRRNWALLFRFNNDCYPSF